MSTPTGYQAAPPRVVPQTRDPRSEVPILLSELDAWFLSLKRSTAAYNSLHASFMSATGQLPEGERKKGLPVFEFTAALEGKESREPVKCVVDLKKVNPEYLGHVMIPLINSQAVDLIEAAEEIKAHVENLIPLLRLITGQTAEQQPAA